MNPLDRFTDADESEEIANDGLTERERDEIEKAEARGDREDRNQ